MKTTLKYIFSRKKKALKYVFGGLQFDDERADSQAMLQTLSTCLIIAVGKVGTTSILGFYRWMSRHNMPDFVQLLPVFQPSGISQGQNREALLLRIAYTPFGVFPEAVPWLWWSLGCQVNSPHLLLLQRPFAT